MLLCLYSLFSQSPFDVDDDAVFLVRWGDGGRCGGSGLPAGTPVPAGHSKRCRLLSRDKCAAMNIRDNYVHYLRTGQWIAIFRPYVELMAEHLASLQTAAQQQQAPHTHSGMSQRLDP
jgi:hypothetical protein